MMSVSINQ